MTTENQAPEGVDGWVTMWPSVSGGRRAIYSPGATKPSYGPELDARLTVYPVYAAPQQAPAEAHGSERDAQEQPFEDWWEREGQFGRAGGGQYEKTFAWNAWCAATQGLQARIRSLSREAWEWSKALEAVTSRAHSDEHMMNFLAPWVIADDPKDRADFLAALRAALASDVQPKGMAEAFKAWVSMQNENARNRMPGDDWIADADEMEPAFCAGFEAGQRSAQAPAPAPGLHYPDTPNKAAFDALYLSLCERPITIHETARRCWKAGFAQGQAAPSPAVGPRYRFWVGDGEAAMLPAADGNWVRYNGWQPIKTAPKDGTHILAWTDASDTVYVICWADADKGIRRELTNESGAQLGWHLAWDGELFDGPFEPTHWMPLPDGPESDVPVQGQ